jgi:hemerythrin superfamily protein
MAPTTKASTATKRAPARSKTAAKKTTRAAKKTTARTAEKATQTAKKATRAAKKATSPITRAAGATRRAATKRSGSAAKRSGSTTTSSREPDAIRVLTDDHREVEELFRRFEKTGDGAHKRRQDLVQRITEALSIHASIEEEIFYPAARRILADSGDVLEALEEHHLVKLTLAELEMMDPSHERYGAKVTVLIENVRHHVEEEEGQLFPTIRKRADAAQLRELGDQLRAAKGTAPTRPHPEAPDTPPGNLVAQVLTAPLDAAANLNKAAARRVRDIVT